MLLPAVIVFAACGSTPRTATNFCRQLANEIDGLADLPATPNAINDAVERYERLLEVAPLAVEDDWRALTELLRAAGDLDASNEEAVQGVVDQAYASERAAQDAMEWVMTNCGVDISSGNSVMPVDTTTP
jgi:hypothetical protein